MMGGLVIGAVGFGVISLLVSAFSGQSPLVALALYSLAGSCGIMVGALHNARFHDRAG